MTPPSRPPRAFISSTSLDLAEYRQDKLKAFKQRIESERVRSTFTTAQHLGGWVLQALRKYAGEAFADSGVPLAGDQDSPARRAVGTEADELAKGSAGGGKVGLLHLVQVILARYLDRRCLLLLVDQWEELYTYKETSAKTARRIADVLEGNQDTCRRAPLPGPDRGRRNACTARRPGDDAGTTRGHRRPVGDAAGG